MLLAAFEAAVHRWLVRGEAGGGLLGLNLGADTWRIYLCYWVWFFVYLGLSLSVGVAAGLGAALLAAILANAQMDPQSVTLIMIAVICVFYAVMIYILIRLAPATAVTVGLRRFAFFNAWTATRGRFWSMLGAFVLLFVTYLVLYIALAAVAGLTVLGPTIGAFANGAPPSAETFAQSLLTPGTLAILLILYFIILVVGLVFYVAFMGVNARAARVAIEEGRLGAAPPAA